MQARPRRDRLPVEAMCALLGVARSTYYHWQHRVGAETATAARRRRLAELVTDAFDRSRRTYGCRRITAQLNRDGHACSVGLVERGRAGPVAPNRRHPGEARQAVRSRRTTGGPQRRARRRRLTGTAGHAGNSR